MRELGGLAEKEKEFARLGVRVYALAAATVDDLAELQQELGEGVTLLADPGAQAIERFQVLDPEPFPDRRLARSATFWIDREGVVRHRWLEESYRARPAPDEILALLRSR